MKIESRFSYKKETFIDTKVTLPNLLKSLLKARVSMPDD